MGMGEFRGVITIATMLVFSGICWWAFRSGNRRRFEEDALLPFADEPGDYGHAAEEGER